MKTTQPAVQSAAKDNPSDIVEIPRSAWNLITLLTERMDEQTMTARILSELENVPPDEFDQFNDYCKRVSGKSVYGHRRDRIFIYKLAV